MMKKLIVLILVLLLLAVSVSAEGSQTNYDAITLEAAHSQQSSSYGKTIAICMGVGLLIGLITVGIMASQMKSVRPQNSAADYVRPGSMNLTNSRDIFLYSHVTRTPRPKSNSSGGSGGSRGGAGGRL